MEQRCAVCDNVLSSGIIFYSNYSHSIGRCFVCGIKLSERGGRISYHWIPTFMEKVSIYWHDHGHLPSDKEDDDFFHTVNNYVNDHRKDFIIAQSLKPLEDV